jgi:hypothetical protein
METVSVVIKMEKEEEAEDDDKCFIPKAYCEEIIKHERQEELNHIIIC